MVVRVSEEILAAARAMAVIARTSGPKADAFALTYLALYCCGYSGHGALDEFEAVAYAVIDTAFVAGLMGEVNDRRPVSGWKVTGWDEKRVFLERDSVAAFATRRDVSGQIAPGSSVTVSVPALAPGQRPGFVLRQGLQIPEDDPVSRLYLNIQATAASWVLGDLARTFDRHELPFLLKVLAHPRAYLRRDACVIYTSSARIGEAVDVLRGALERAAVRLEDGVPLFTRELAAGIGTADDLAASGIGERSYGQWVGGLFFKAAASSTDPKDIAQLVAEAISASGRDLEHPYLRPQGQR